ncbi:MAG: TonB-dependent receptor plug domain-containing protein [Caulobacteraceae bacterium]
MSAAQTAHAQAVGAQADASSPSSSVSEVIVTGTRQTGVKAADSAAPIEVVGAAALQQRTGNTDLANALATAVPSLNVQQYGSDAAALTVQAALRGLNPNDTLVLVNGKRRHATSSLSVDGGSPYSGSATVDLSFIPVGAIDHVEVLTDGAAAQYGSDAIAGVVNIILKDANHGGTVSATGGQYYEGDGDTGAIYANDGFAIGDKGFVNFTLEDRFHGFSRQGGADRRLSNPDGSLLSSVAGTTNAGVVNEAGYPNVNNIYGDTQSQVYDGFYNAGYNFSDNLQLYSFGSLAHRQASAYENYRVANKVEGTTSTGETVIPFPDGFEPREQFKEVDYSFTIGLKGDLDTWHYDLSSTYGGDRNSISTIDSANASLYPILQAESATAIAPQTDFADGAFKSTEWNNTLDVDKTFDVGLASPLNLGFGGEYRQDTFSITAGEPSSYYGTGAQSFLGYTPLDAGFYTRNNYAGYVDVAADVVKGLHLDIAGRYEDYSDFGSNEVGKFTARYDFSPMLAVRGTVSNGFRAPTLQEEYYSGTNVGPSSAFIQLPANSAAAQLAGFSALKPERSTNYSIGFVAHPMPKLQITADFYQIDLENRILNSGSLIGLEGTYPNQTIVSQAVLDAITARGVTLDKQSLTYAGINIFTNGANTRTDGIEATATYSSDFDEFGHVDWSMGFNYNDTTLVKIKDTTLTPAVISALLTGTPKEKAVLQAFWTLHKWSVNLRETIYGPTTEVVSFDGTGATTSAGYTNLEVGTTAITDLDIGYKFTPNLKLDVGANNLFNKKPPTVPNGVNSGVQEPVDGSNVYNEPVTFSPYGINGGYYYGRITFSF